MKLKQKQKNRKRKKLKCKPGFKQQGAVCKPIKAKKTAGSGKVIGAAATAIALTGAAAIAANSKRKTEQAKIEQANPLQTPTYNRALVAGGVSATAAIGAIAYGGREVVKDVQKNHKPRQDVKFLKNEQPSAEDIKRYEQELQPGDLIRRTQYNEVIGHYDHYAVYTGKDSKTGDLQAVGLSPEANSKGSIAYEAINRKVEDADGDRISAYEKVPAHEINQRGKSQTKSKEQIVADAKSMVGREFSYKLFSSNCESFARAIVEGDSYSSQGNKYHPLSRFIAETGIDLLMQDSSVQKTGKAVNSKQLVEELEKRRPLIQELEKKRPRFDGQNSLDNDNSTSFSSMITASGRFKAPEEYDQTINAVVSGFPGNINSKIREKLYQNYLLAMFAYHSDISSRQDSRRRNKLKCKPGYVQRGAACQPVRKKKTKKSGALANTIATGAILAAGAAAAGFAAKKNKKLPPSSSVVPKSNNKYGKIAAIGGTAAFLGIAVAADRHYKISDPLVSNAAATAHNTIVSVENIDQKIDKSPLSDENKTKAKNLVGTAKTFTADLALTKRGYKRIKLDPKNNAVFYQTPHNSIRSMSSVGSSIVTSEMQLVNKLKGFPVYEVGFKIDNTYDRKTKGKDTKLERRKAISLARKADLLYEEQLKLIPNDALLRAKPHKDDGAGEKRQRIYEKKGFTNVPGIHKDYLFLFKNQGEIHPIRNEQTLKTIHWLYDTERNDTNLTTQSSVLIEKQLGLIPGLMSPEYVQGRLDAAKRIGDKIWVKNRRAKGGGYWRKHIAKRKTTSTKNKNSLLTGTIALGATAAAATAAYKVNQKSVKPVTTVELKSKNIPAGVIGAIAGAGAAGAAGLYARNKAVKETKQAAQEELRTKLEITEIGIRNRQSKYESKIGDLRTELETQQAQSQKLQQDLDAANERATGLTRAETTVKKRVTALESKNKKLEADSLELSTNKATLDETNGILTRVQSEAKELKSQIEVKNSELSQLNDKSQELEQQIKTISVERDNANLEIEQLRVAAEVEQEKSKQLESQLLKSSQDYQQQLETTQQELQREIAKGKDPRPLRGQQKNRGDLLSTDGGGIALGASHRWGSSFFSSDISAQQDKIERQAQKLLAKAHSDRLLGLQRKFTEDIQRLSSKNRDRPTARLLNQAQLANTKPKKLAKELKGQEDITLPRLVELEQEVARINAKEEVFNYIEERVRTEALSRYRESIIKFQESARNDEGNYDPSLITSKNLNQFDRDSRQITKQVNTQLDKTLNQINSPKFTNRVEKLVDDFLEEQPTETIIMRRRKQVSVQLAEEIIKQFLDRSDSYAQGIAEVQTRLDRKKKLKCKPTHVQRGAVCQPKHKRRKSKNRRIVKSALSTAAVIGAGASAAYLAERRKAQEQISAKSTNNQKWKTAAATGAGLSIAGAGLISMTGEIPHPSTPNNPNPSTPNNPNPSTPKSSTGEEKFYSPVEEDDEPPVIKYKAINDYAGSYYSRVNRYLTNPDSLDSNHVEHTKKLIANLYKELDELPPVQPESNHLSRFIILKNTEIESLKQVYLPGETFIEKRFASTTANLDGQNHHTTKTVHPEEEHKVSTLVYRIKPKANNSNGRLIRDYSDLPEENEVLFKANTKFKVISTNDAEILIKKDDTKIHKVWEVYIEEID